MFHLLTLLFVFILYIGCLFIFCNLAVCFRGKKSENLGKPCFDNQQPAAWGISCYIIQILHWTLHPIFHSALCGISSILMPYFKGHGGWTVLQNQVESILEFSTDILKQEVVFRILLYTCNYVNQFCKSFKMESRWTIKIKVCLQKTKKNQ